MDPLLSIIFAISGGLMVGSILMSRIGLNRSVLSRMNASVLSGVGVGVGGIIFIYYGVSNGDILESFFVGIISGLTAGFTVYISSKWWR